MHGEPSVQYAFCGVEVEVPPSLTADDGADRLRDSDESARCYSVALSSDGIRVARVRALRSAHMPRGERSRGRLHEARSYEI